MAAAGLFALAACSSSGGTPDQDLAGLVVAPASVDPKLDAAKAATDADVLARSMAAPHRKVIAALGAHRVRATARVDVLEGTTPVESLTTELTIDYTGSGEYHAVLDNSADYGREVFHVGGAMYLRPRYGQWHRRPPNDDGEAAQVVAEMYGELAAHYQLLARAVDVADKGALDHSGRPARRIAIALSKEPRKPAPEPLAQRKWREGIAVEAAAGEVVLDAKAAVPLHGHITGQVAFARDGRRFTMKLDVTQDVTPLATPPVFTLPPADEQVATPERPREVEERDFLLEGMAPQTRRKQEGP